MTDDDPCDDPVWRQGFAAGYAGALEREKQAHVTGFECGQDHTVELVEELLTDDSFDYEERQTVQRVLNHLEESK